MDDKLRNGQTLPATLVAGDSVGDVKLIGERLVRIISKSSPTRGVVALTGVKEVVKEGAGSGQAWGQFEPLYWDVSESRVTTTASGNVPCGIAAAAANSVDTSGQLLLNGLPAIDGY